MNQPDGPTDSCAASRAAYWSKNTLAVSSRLLRTPTFAKIDFRWSCTV